MRICFQTKDIDESSWLKLVKESPTSTWFQTPEAFRFYTSLSDIWEPFLIAVADNDQIKGLVTGIIQKDGGRIKRFFSRRAIILGGPVLDKSITPPELVYLLQGTSNYLKKKAIYIETRNFSDYSDLCGVFEQCGFHYEHHLNFLVQCDDWDVMTQRIGKHRRRYIRQSLREGASIVENPTIDQVKQFYIILADLYRTKVKKPLYPWHFFMELYKIPSGRFNLVEYNGRIIGGSACVCLQEKAVYEWFACGQDGIYKGIHPSSLTKVAGIRYAFDHGFPFFDMMGAGKPNEKYGVRDFKAEFGGLLVDYGRFLYICNHLLFAIGKLGIKLLNKL